MASRPQFPVTIRRTRLLRPRVLADVIPRPGLIERLEQGLRGSLVLLASPPGFGKTTLICDWAARSSIPVAWLSIDERGDDLRSFVSHVVAAIQMVDPEVGADTIALLNQPEHPSPRAIAGTLDDELLDLTDEVVLVLDDYHLLAEPGVHEFVEALLDHPPPSLHLVIATRADPPLPLARLRMRGQLTELRAGDLRFTARETAAFLDGAAGLSLDAGTAAEIERRAEGWAAGLRLAALTLQDRAAPDAVLAAFEGRRLRGLMGALVDDVLAAQPEEVRTFLLRTSVVERVCAPLAVALLGSDETEEPASKTLDLITRANLFITPLEQEPHWHRYHALFRDALRERLRAGAGHAGVTALHARASAWFADQGLIDEAIHHARAAGDDEAAARIVERQVHVALDRDDVPLLESWLRLLPADATETRPALILGRSWTAYLRGKWVMHGRLLAEAEALLDAGTLPMDEAEVAALRGEIEVGRSMRLLDTGDSAGAGEAARRALRLVPNSKRYVFSLALYQGMFVELIDGRGSAAVERLNAFLAGYDGPPDMVFVRMLIGLTRIHSYMGNLQASHRTASDALRLSSQLGFSSNVSWAHYQLGAIEYEWNNLDAALAHFSAVVADPERARMTALRDATFGLALTLRARGLESEARATIERLQASLRESANMEQLALVGILQSHFASDSYEGAGGAAPASDRSQRPSQLVGLMGNPDVIRIQALLRLPTDENLAEAEQLIESILDHARRLHFVGGEIEVLALRSVLHRLRGQAERAADTLERALDLAAPGGFVRTFLDRGQALAVVLRALRPRSRHAAYIDRLLGATDAAAPAGATANASAEHRPAPPIGAVDQLTDREVEILEKLAARLSNKEIADALVISPFTVKAHASNIYGKLGASGRRQAIIKARSLGLLAEV